MATVTIEYFGMDGAGRTLTDAKKDAGRKIEAAMKGSYEPTVLASRGVVILLWRDPYGWRHSTITDGGDDKGNGGFRDKLSYSSGNDYAYTLQSALSHLAQQTWDGAEELPPCLGSAASLIVRRDINGRAVLGEFKSWRGFQLAYKVAIANGIDDNARHQWACEHGHEYAA